MASSGYFYFIKDNVSKDIYTIFDSTNPQAVAATGFKQNGSDLSTLYTPLGYYSNLIYSTPTNLFSGPYNKDLNAIFALNFISTSTTAAHYTFPVNSGIAIVITGTGNLYFNYPVNYLYMYIIGAGGGGAYTGNNDGGGAGGGGGGGFGAVGITSTSFNISYITSLIGVPGAPNNTGGTIVKPDPNGRTSAQLFQANGTVVGAFESWAGGPGGYNCSYGGGGYEGNWFVGSGGGGSSCTEGEMGGMSGLYGSGRILNTGPGITYTSNIWIPRSGFGGYGQGNKHGDGAGGGGGGSATHGGAGDGQDATVNKDYSGGNGGQGNVMSFNQGGLTLNILVCGGGGGGPGGNGDHTEQNVPGAGVYGGGDGGTPWTGAAGGNAKNFGGGGGGATNNKDPNGNPYPGGYGYQGALVLVILQGNVNTL